VAIEEPAVPPGSEVPNEILDGPVGSMDVRGISLRVGGLMVGGLLGATDVNADGGVDVDAGPCSPMDNGVEPSDTPDAPSPRPPEENVEVVDGDTECLFSPKSGTAVGFDTMEVLLFARVANKTEPATVAAATPVEPGSGVMFPDLNL
jgi:hypothetical protein